MPPNPAACIPIPHLVPSRGNHSSVIALPPCGRATANERDGSIIVGSFRNNRGFRDRASAYAADYRAEDCTNNVIGAGHACPAATLGIDFGHPARGGGTAPDRLNLVGRRAGLGARPHPEVGEPAARTAAADRRDALTLADHALLLAALTVAAWLLTTSALAREVVAGSVVAVWPAWAALAVVFGVAMWRGGR